MLDILRSKSRSVLTYVLFGIIIVVFVVSFGPGSQGCQVEGLSQTSAVEVDGYVVAPADYEEAYGNLFRNYQARMGQTFTRELADQLGLRNVAMNQLVDRVLVVQEAKRRGLRVTPDEMNRAVWAIPSFQTDGKFDIELYRRAVRQAYGSESRFEERLVDDLLFTKMLALIREGALVSEDEIRAAWMADADRVDLECVRFPLAAARKEAKVTDAEVAALLKADAARVQKAYEANASRYEVKKKVKARHILVKVPEGAPAAQDEAAKKKVEGYAERVKKEPFAQVAKEVSEDAATQGQGRRPGLVRPGPHGEALRGRGLRAQGRARSPPPVRTRFGWHIILVEGVEDGRVVPLKEVEKDLAREVLELEAAEKIADRRAREALAQAKVGKKLEVLFPAPARREEGRPVRSAASRSWPGRPARSTPPRATSPASATSAGALRRRRRGHDRRPDPPGRLPHPGGPGGGPGEGAAAPRPRPVRAAARRGRGPARLPPAGGGRDGLAEDAARRRQGQGERRLLRGERRRRRTGRPPVLERPSRRAACPRRPRCASTP